MYEVKESDWKLFKEKVPSWQENFMEKLNNEYIELLKEDKLASEKFWALEKRINKDKNKYGVQFVRKRSTMAINLVALINEGAITFNDLADFSDELKEVVSFMLNA